MYFRSSNNAFMPEILISEELSDDSIRQGSPCSSNSMSSVDLLKNQILIDKQYIKKSSNQCLIVPHINSSQHTSPSVSSATYPTSQTRQRRLHVSNIPFRFRENDLINLVKAYGTVLEAEIIFNSRGSKGYGFVTFASASDAERAKKFLNGAFVEGRIIEVNSATAKFFRRSVNNDFPVNAAKKMLLMQSMMSPKNENIDPNNHLNNTFYKNISNNNLINNMSDRKIAGGADGFLRGGMETNADKHLSHDLHLQQLHKHTINIITDSAGNIIHLPAADHHVIETLNRNTIQSIQRAQLTRRNVQAITAHHPIDTSSINMDFARASVLNPVRQPYLQIRTLLNPPIPPHSIPGQMLRSDYQRFSPY